MKENGFEEGGSMNSFGEDYDYNGNSFTSNHQYKIYGTSINYLLDNNILKIPNYIKIDVDGYELNVLQGAVNTIKKYNPLLIVEQENGDTRAIDFCKINFNYGILTWDVDHRNVILGKLK